MKSAELPGEKAFEPDEEAHQPSTKSAVTKMVESKKSTLMVLSTANEFQKILNIMRHWNVKQCNYNKNNNIPSAGPISSKKIKFAGTVDMMEKNSVEINSSYKDILSQPAPSLTHIEKLFWLQKRRTAGLWAQCDKCDRWRYLPDIIDRHELPDKWYCSMNPDPDFANCSVPEAPLRLRDEEDLIHSQYTAGSVVWARLAGWPWWPAMVDDCPDTEQFYWLDGFSDIPTSYNVVFFDTVEATRAWITPENLKPYAANRNKFQYLLKNKKYSFRLKVAISQADEADSLTVQKRLEKFSFISRHSGSINNPKKVNLNDLKKHQKYLKKKFNIEFPIVNSDSEDEVHMGNANVIMLGTPKRARKDEVTNERQLVNGINKKDKGITNNEKDKAETATKESDYQKQNLKVNLINSDKPSNSMAVQIGSTETTVFDNDTSTTYLPNDGTENHTVDAPNSDDFEF